jgi:TolB-like protein
LNGAEQPESIMHRAILVLCAWTFVGINPLLGAEPATQPSRREPPNILILPFTPPAEAKYQWIGKGVQQDLASALAPNLRGRALAPASAGPAADAAAALKLGREAGAEAVLFGQAQVLNDQVRLTGQIIEVPSGKSLESLKQSGPVTDLFKLEDALTQQAIAGLPESFLNLRGLTSSRRMINPPRVIQLPGDVQTPWPNNSPIDGGPNVNFIPSTPLPPGYPPPYSAYAGSYPWRFTYPYSHLFSYDYDPDPFLPIYGGFPDRFAGHGHGHHHEAARPRP